MAAMKINRFHIFYNVCLQLLLWLLWWFCAFDTNGQDKRTNSNEFSIWLKRSSVSISCVLIFYFGDAGSSFLVSQFNCSIVIRVLFRLAEGPSRLVPSEPWSWTFRRHPTRPWSAHTPCAEVICILFECRNYFLLSFWYIIYVYVHEKYRRVL